MLTILLVLAIKKKTLFIKIECHPKSFWRRHLLPNKCSSFLFYANSFATYILAQHLSFNKAFCYEKSSNIKKYYLFNWLIILSMLLSLTGTFIDECHPSYIKHIRRWWFMKTKTFILKFLRLISLILLLSTLLVLAVKN